MSQRQIKKQRQFLRRQFQEQYQETARSLAELDRKFLKPKPLWIPSAVWIFMLRFFVHIK